jgi:cytochrome c-type biogenesis protein CcmE
MARLREESGGMDSNKKWLAAGTALALLAAGALIFGPEREMSYFVPPSKVGAGGTPTDAPLRVGGVVKPGSLRAGSPGVPARLVLSDGTSDLEVEFDGTLPALLREGQEAVAFGRLQSGVLRAERVIPKFDDPLKKTP